MLLTTVPRAELVALYRRELATDIASLVDGDLEFYFCPRCHIKFFYPVIPGDEPFYNSLQEFDWYYVTDKPEYQVAKVHIASGDTVLDVGSGRGAFAGHLPHATFIGLDASEHAGEMARSAGVDVRCQSIEDYAESQSQSVDVVTAFQVLEHVADPHAFVESMLAALKPGGKLIIAVPSEDSFWGQVSNNTLNLPPHHLTRWPDETFRFMATDFNLELEEIYHERVQAIHEEVYFSTLVQGWFLAPRPVDRRPVRRVIAGIAWRLARLLSTRVASWTNPNGHTVLAVFRKSLDE